MRSTAFIILMSLFFVSACSKEVLEPETFGHIHGVVVDAQTNNGIGNVSIETTPATQAIVTDDNGSFELNDIATGTYLVKASRATYVSKSVNILVRDDEVTSATILLGGGEDTSGLMEAEVTSWYQSDGTDSSYVDVEFRVQNISNSTTFKRYEVYFDIYNNQETLYFEVADTSLNAGEFNIGQFRKDVRDSVVDSVVVSGTWISE